MAASLHYELVYFSSFQIPHSISNGPTQSFLWLNLFDHSWKNSRLDLPNALYHKQTRIPRWTVIWFSFDNLFRHFNSQYRKYYLYLWPLPVKRTWKWLVQKGLSTELNEHESRMRLYPSECLCLLRKDDLGDIADPMNQIISAWVFSFNSCLNLERRSAVRPSGQSWHILSPGERAASLNLFPKSLVFFWILPNM